MIKLVIFLILIRIVQKIIIIIKFEILLNFHFDYKPYLKNLAY